MATPALSAISEIVVLFVPFVVKSSNAVLNRASFFCFLFDSTFPIRKPPSKLRKTTSLFIIIKTDQKSILQKIQKIFWTHWSKRILTNGQFWYITLYE